MGGSSFYSEKITEGWDGADSKSDLFTWVIIIKDEMGTIRKKVGEVSLIR